MTRRGKREVREAHRLAENAIKLLVLGAVFTLAPFFLGNSIFGKALAALTPVGLLMLAAGALMLWLSRRAPEASEPSAPAAPRPSSTWRPRPTVPRPVDRTPAELDRRAAETATPRNAEPARPSSWGTGVFDVIEWRRFEALVEDLFRQGGFETKSQSHGADGGVDVWLYSRNEPGAPVSVVQCKHWQGKRVGVDKIRELRGVMAAHNVRRGQFATTSTFTPDAIAFAAENSINLLDVNALVALIARRTSDQQQQLLRVALEGDYWRPTCVNCGVKMLDKKPRKGGASFWGCANYPKCKTTMPMRSA